MIFPWHKEQWQQIWKLHRETRLPHALLFSGIAGIGKKQFATALANSLLCSATNDEGMLCGQCHSCQLRSSQSHPDLLLIEPEESSSVIKIDQIRDVVDFVNQTALIGEYRVIIINPANAMNVNAANALLKSLEEPTEKCIFILITDQSGRLPATIRSRCQKIVFTKPDLAPALSWIETQSVDVEDPEIKHQLLKLANGAPLRALELLSSDFLKQRHQLYQGLLALSQRKQDPLQFAATWLEVDFQRLYGLLLSFLQDLLRFKLTSGQADLINQDYKENIIQLMKKMKIKNIIRYIDCAQKTYATMTGPSNLNRQLVLEELFIEWVNHVSS